MASKSSVHEMLTVFSQIWGKKQLPDLMVQAYEKTLRVYTDQDIREAGYVCMDECEYFPKPSDISKRIKAARKDQAHDKDLKERFTCPVCKNPVSLLFEGTCMECHSGAPLSAGREPVVKKQWSRERNYVMQDSTRCQKCGNVGMSTKEPADVGQFLCRQCYTGLTSNQISERFHDVQKMLSDKTFKPDWVKMV